MSKCFECPCNYQEDEALTVGYCTMEGGQTLTDVEHDCPYAPILKLLASAKEVKDLYVYAGDGSTDFVQVEFWIRR